MNVTRVEVPGYEVVYRLAGEPSGFVALHRTVGGKAFGGLRIRAYPDAQAALDDALRLARAMSLKLASVEIPGGGGKAVLEASSLGSDRAATLARFADWVESLGGAYVTGPDLGVGDADIAVMQRHTKSIASGDLSSPTALGLRQAMRGALRSVFGDGSLSGRGVAVQGLGAIGGRLVRLLAEEGARVVGADVDPATAAARATELGLRVVSAHEILEVECDILAPCAIGGVIGRELVPSLRARIVCGGANNMLDEDATADVLHERGVMLVPDFLANAGGAVHGAWTHLRGPGDYTAEVLKIEQRVAELLAEATRRGRPPLRVALERYDVT